MMTAGATRLEAAERPRESAVAEPRRPAVRRPIVHKLIVSFVAVIAIMSVVYVAVGVRLIGDRVVGEAQEKVVRDLNAAREMTSSELARVNDVVRLTAGRFFLREAYASGDIASTARELSRTMAREGLDVLTLTDSSGRVLLRAGSAEAGIGDDESLDPIVASVLRLKAPKAGYAVISAEDLAAESPELAARARTELVDTPMARPRSGTVQTSGMMLKAGAPVFSDNGELIGVLYGGVLLNRNNELVDKIKQTLYQDLTYNGKDIGTATIFLDDVRVATNVRNEGLSRAIGTRVSEEVYDHVVGKGEQWLGRAYVVNDWYISAYEPIRDAAGEIIGILYVGMLEDRYDSIRNRAVLPFFFVTLLGALIAMAAAYLLARPITRSLGQLVAASSEVAQGNLDTKVAIQSNDEFEELADTFNTMAGALKARDRLLKEQAETCIRKSERLALVGQLAAGVAHELNNPLQGIVTYSLLTLEELPAEDDDARSSLETIVKQAERCTKIVRGLLDFSRQKKSCKQPYSVSRVLDECLTLVQHQSLFHNIAIEKRYADDLPDGLIDPSQIQQVFMNLIINAAEAMNGEGLLVVSASHDRANDRIEVVVADSGSGIHPDDLPKVFVPFFTTKEAGHGVGLGLAISYGIVEEHGGSITVDSELGVGTTFTVKLPVATDEEIARSEDGADEPTVRYAVAAAVDLQDDGVAGGQSETEGGASGG